MTRQTRAEAAAQAADYRHQEQGPADAPRQRTATTYLHCTHPETGLQVVFIPGEAIPEWAVT